MVQELGGMGKIPPQAIDVEEFVLGTLILEPNSIFDAEQYLRPEKFYKDAHQKIFKAILDTKNNGIGIDLLTVTNRLKKNNDLELVGGAYALTMLVSNVGLSYNLIYHCLIIQQEYIKRLAIEKAALIQNIAYSESDIEEIIKAIDDLTIKFDEEIQSASGNFIHESNIRLEESVKYEPHFFAFKENDKLIGLMSKSNISLWLGKAKSRKTFAITKIASHLCTGMIDELIWCKKCTVSYFDTEQSRHHAHKIVKRVSFLNDSESHIEGFNMYAIKRYDTNQRKKIIETVIKKDRPDVVIIDGIRDLMLDFNDLKETTQLVNWLMMLIDKYNCHLSLILHLNKSDQNARGHIGTELINKCESAVVIEKSQDDANKSILRPMETRGEQFKAIEMEIIHGFPYFKGYVDYIEPKNNRFNDLKF